MVEASAQTDMAAPLFRASRVLRALPSPCYVPPGIMGNVPHLTPDICATVGDLKAQAVDFADIASSVPLVQAKRTDLRAFLNAGDCALLLSARDYTNQSNPPSSRSGFMIATASGRQTITPEQYMQAADLLRPELVVALADEAPASGGQNRQRAAVQTSLDWLDACIAHNASKAPMCGVVVGGGDEQLRRLSAAQTTAREVDAVVLSGLDACADDEERSRLIEAALSEVAKPDIPRILTGIGHPLQVLKAVASGVDAFVSPFPATLTKEMVAMAFWVEEGGADDSPEREALRKERGSVLYLREKRYERDFGPLLPGCECYACKNFTRAYLHHMLNVREMLGDILLYLHNLQHYYRFFAAIRRAIDTGVFPAYLTAFSSKYSEQESTASPPSTPLLVEERKRQREADKAAEKAAARAKKHQRAE